MGLGTSQDVENLHSVVHHKSKVSAALQYVRDFGSTAKESPKRKIAWSAYYYTSCWSWYPVPEGALGLFEILSMSQASVVKASKDEISMMREWATAHGSSVGQRTVRQETTMARAGTLPDFLYQKKIEVGERIDVSSNSVETTDSSSVSSITNAEDEVTEYDSSSDEEICEAEDLVAEGTSDLGNQQITRNVDFLVGVTSRFGRPVRVISRFVLLSPQNSLNLRFTYSYNLQRFVFPSGEGQELGLTPGTCRSKFQLLQFV